MKHELVVELTGNFEAHSQEMGWVEFWVARDLQHLLGYKEWRNFVSVIHRAKTAYEVSLHAIANPLVDANKMVDLGSGTTREIDGIMLRSS